MEDLHNNIDVRPVIPPVVDADNTPLVGLIIDRQGFNSLEYVIAAGAIADADATFTVLLEEGDSATLTDAAPVDDAHLLGTELLAGFTFADDNKTRKLGYIGNKRYTKLTITPVNNLANALISAVAVLGDPANAPTINPPA